MYSKRELQVLVISDVHLGTFGCHAKELLHYLKSVNPQTLILNGDIIDMWNFSKNYFPASHMDVLRQIMKMASHGSKVYYITGNHDEMLRKYTDLQLGNLEIVDKLVLDFKDEITTGPAVDVGKPTGVDGISKWTQKKASAGEMFSSFKLGAPAHVKAAVRYNDLLRFYKLDKKYDGIICGHIHSANIRKFGKMTYMCCGDWCDTCSAIFEKNGVYCLEKY